MASSERIRLDRKGAGSNVHVGNMAQPERKDLMQTGFAEFCRAESLKHLNQSHNQVGLDCHRMFSADNQPAGWVQGPPAEIATPQLAIYGISQALAWAFVRNASVTTTAWRRHNVR
jgi:hypothetical protein